MATRRSRLNDTISGLAVAAYLVTVPLLAPVLWRRPLGPQQTTVHWCIAVLAVSWALVAFQVVRAIVRTRRGLRQSGGFAWLAGAIMSIGSFLVPSVASAATTHHHHSAHVGVEAAVGLPMALVAKKRRDELLQLRSVLADDSVDSAIHDLRKRNDGFLHALRAAIGRREAGTVTIRDNEQADHYDSERPLVAIPILRLDDAWTFQFAHVGSQLDLPAHVTRADVVSRLVALHERGGVLFGDSVLETLRHLVLREHDGIVVVHVGADELDAEIRQQCVVARCRSLATTPVTVRLLQPEAAVEGLDRPFDADLRRKCIEMLSYLSVHPDFGVSGDRLRARVLGSRENDASVRTLNNTASALRRSLGESNGESRLAPVGANGLYRLRDVTCDVTEFFSLIDQARQYEGATQQQLLLSAITLVRGEPLVAEPRGYEWFLAEGHYARVVRALEFAVVTLLDAAQAQQDTEIEWRARDAIGRFDPLHALADVDIIAARRTDR